MGNPTGRVRPRSRIIGLVLTIRYGRRRYLVKTDVKLNDTISSPDKNVDSQVIKTNKQLAELRLKMIDRLVEMKNE